MAVTDTAQGAGDAAAGIDEITDLQLDLMKGTGLGRRGQHAKPHGCVRAAFEVLADIPDPYKVGLFAKPATYTAYIRYSNGSQPDDTKGDLHGMAIKLTRVPGRKIIEAEASATTHDFILADKPVFFIRDLDEYVRFMKDFAQTVPHGKAPLKFMAWLTFHHPKDLPILLKFRNQNPDSPLVSRYWSQVPYAFDLGGDTICRYAAVPRAGNMITPIAPADRDGEYLRRAMVDHLTTARRAATFDFTVQLRSDATADVIDNPTVVWDTPEQRVATITIPPQKLDSPEQMRFCENLSYTPWHALPEHRPVGQINEIRKTVYLASSKLRHDTNQAPRTEPNGDEQWSFLDATVI
jgi:catalase